MTKVFVFLLTVFLLKGIASAEDLSASFESWLLAETSSQEKAQADKGTPSVAKDDIPDTGMDLEANGDEEDNDIESNLADPDIQEDENEDIPEVNPDDLAESPFDPDKDLEVETHSATDSDIGDKPVPMEEIARDMEKNREIASSKPQKSGFRKTRKNCNMRSLPNAKGKKLGAVTQGRKLWTETTKSGWVKVFRKKGTAFLSPTCF